MSWKRPATAGASKKQSFVHVRMEDGRTAAIAIDDGWSESVVWAVFAAAAQINEVYGKYSLKLTDAAGRELQISSKLRPNSPDDPYLVTVVEGRPSDAKDLKPASISVHDVLREGGDLIDTTSNVVASIRLRQISKGNDFFDRQPRYEVDQETLEMLKRPDCNVMRWDDGQLSTLLEAMFVELGLVEVFKIDLAILKRFLYTIEFNYNSMAFHNWRHGFCVAQMMYSILFVTGLERKLRNIEKLSLLVASIAHDLNHPGLTNSYQINAHTELAMTYNDQSPLEMHHAALCFWIISAPETNIAKNLTPQEYKEFRRTVISCILSTDQSIHAQMVARFSAITKSFDYDNSEHRLLLLQWLVKCADISNEVRPAEFATVWANKILEEFFGQADREKAEGLPVLPFMDRNLVNMADTQLQFIRGALLPSFELLATVLPNLDDILRRIHDAMLRYEAEKHVKRR